MTGVHVPEKTLSEVRIDLCVCVAFIRVIIRLLSLPSSLASCLLLERYLCLFLVLHFSLFHLCSSLVVSLSSEIFCSVDLSSSLQSKWSQLPLPWTGTSSHQDMRRRQHRCHLSTRGVLFEIP
jgi:hypothetical protein